MGAPVRGAEQIWIGRELLLRLDHNPSLLLVEKLHGFESRSRQPSQRLFPRGAGVVAGERQRIHRGRGCVQIADQKNLGPDRLNGVEFQEQAAGFVVRAFDPRRFEALGPAGRPW
jgi:hypothetical protein